MEIIEEEKCTRSSKSLKSQGGKWRRRQRKISRNSLGQVSIFSLWFLSMWFDLNWFEIDLNLMCDMMLYNVVRILEKKPRKQNVELFYLFFFLNWLSIRKTIDRPTFLVHWWNRRYRFSNLLHVSRDICINSVYLDLNSYQLCTSPSNSPRQP